LKQLSQDFIGEWEGTSPSWRRNIQAMDNIILFAAMVGQILFSQHEIINQKFLFFVDKLCANSWPPVKLGLKLIDVHVMDPANVIDQHTDRMFGQVTGQILPN
jgi:hypothetical protein